MVGEGLKNNRNLNYHLDEEGKRCWTLIYKNYHLDILPAVNNPNQDYIYGTNKDANGNYTYIKTSPKKYQEWFLSIAKNIIPFY